MNKLDKEYQYLLDCIISKGLKYKQKMKKQINLFYKFETLVVGTTAFLILLTEIVIHI